MVESLSPLTKPMEMQQQISRITASRASIPRAAQSNSGWLVEKYFMFGMSLWGVYNQYKPIPRVRKRLESIFIFGIFIVYVLSMMSDPALCQSKRILKHFLSKCLRAACVEVRESMLSDSAYPYWILTKLHRCVGVCGRWELLQSVPVVPGWLNIVYCFLPQLHTQNK